MLDKMPIATVKSTFMDLALQEARDAAYRGEVPIGAVIVNSHGKVIASDGNRTEELFDPTGHAEIGVIRQACSLLNAPRLPDCSIYVTVEPCPMCATAISFTRLARLYYGASDRKGGGVESGPRIFHQPTCHHVPELYPGICEKESAELVKAFFRERR